MNVSSVNVACPGPIHQPIVQYCGSPASLVDREAFIRASNSEDTNEQSEFFKQSVWWQDFEKGNYGLAVQRGKELLKECQEIDSTAYSRICKGFPYVWIGIAAFLVHDYEAAVFFIDAAASEDARMYSDKRLPPDHIASRFLRLDKDEIDHHANKSVGALVGDARQRIQDLLADYETYPGCAQSPLTIDHIRDKFLEPALNKPEWRSLATSFISFVLESKDRSQWLDLRPGPGTAEPFFLHLFKGCLLFESLLKAKPGEPPKGNTLGRVLCELSYELVGKLSCDLVPVKKNHKNKWKKKCWDISESDLGNLLENLPDGRSIDETITLTGRLRNTLGHNLGWMVDLSRGKYDCLVRAVGSSCLHAIACLYVDQGSRRTSDGETR